MKNNPYSIRSRDAYSRCKWCKGSGCLACNAQADIDYKTAFPEGPQPIATFRTDDPAAMQRLQAAMQADGIQTAATARAEELLASPVTGSILAALGVNLDEGKRQLATRLMPEVMAQRLVDAAKPENTDA